MYLNQFSVRIPEGRERSSGYVELDHMQRYTLILRNNRSVRCSARVRVDGNDVGSFRIEASATIRLERSTINDGYFTACLVDSREGEQGQLDNANPDLGLISVTFIPEVVYRHTGIPKFPPGCSSEIEELTSGFERCSLSASESKSPAMGTVSTGHSKQQFITVPPLVLDYTQETTIHLRIVRRQGSTVRPLTQRETPIPPRMF